MINVSTLAMIGGSSGNGIEERPKSIVVSKAVESIPMTESNRATIRELKSSAVICLTESLGNENNLPSVSPVVLSVTHIKVSVTKKGGSGIGKVSTNSHHFAVS